MNYRVKILFIFIFILFIHSELFSQTPISGVINRYSKVISLSNLKDTLVVSDAALFSDGDTVLFIQMQGAGARTTTSNNEELFGRVDQGNANKTGKYEIIIVKKVISAENKVILRNPLSKIYDGSKSIQLIKLPFFRSAVVTSTLTCDPWDGEKGGVVAIMVADTLVLNANIDVSAKGFRGADPVLSDGNCTNTDSLLYRSYYFDESFNGAGRKGEGIASYDALYAKGLGRWGNGGGGGNGRFAGGGGGGSASSGGLGGEEDSLACNTPEYIGEIRPEPFNDTLIWRGIGGRGGQGLTSTFLFTDSTIFMGGGGGSGTYTGSLTASTGGNGAGIIIIISNYIKPNGYSLIANGQTVTTTATASGAGGGGGGVVAIDIQNLSSDLTLSVKGGVGGSTSGINITGPGGGGGGGIILNALSTQPSKFKIQINGGTAGTVSDRPAVGSYHATFGNDGVIRNNFKIQLSGFLFNTILESQKICIGDVPGLISGSVPKGGDGNFVFTWQKKTNSTGWTIIADSVRRDLQPPAIYDTTYYRRIVSSAGINDTSLSVGIYIHKKIVGNIIDFIGLDTICIDHSASNLTGEIVTEGGDGTGTFTYTWQSSFDLSNWNTISPLVHPTNPVNDTICWGGIISDTTYFRRRVASGACYSFSDTIEIIGLPKITNNILPDFQEICFSNKPDEIQGLIPQNGLGDASYYYNWQRSFNGASWTTITDSSRINFASDTLKTDRYFRRIVTSGDCIDTSDYHMVNVLPLISNNAITDGALVNTCYNIPSDQLIGSDPTGGDDIYRYLWQISTNTTSWNEIAEDNTLRDYQPLAQTDSMYYRRIVRSGIDDCCVDTSGYTKVDIWSLPIGTLSAIDDTICSKQLIDLNFEISSGASPYSLYYTDSYLPFVRNNITTASSVIAVNPSTTDLNKLFTYTIDSIKDVHGCLATNLTGEAKVTVYGWPVANSGIDLEICDTTLVLYAEPSKGTGAWSLVSGVGNAIFEEETLSNSRVHVDVSGLYDLQWEETSWECSDSDTVKILFYRKPIQVNAGNDTTLYFETEHTLNGSYINPDEIKSVSVEWSKIGGPGLLSDQNSLNAVISELYGFFKTNVELLFTVSKGDATSECFDVVDTLIIQLEPISTPTGFSPNGDGVNDFFIIKGVDNTISSELIIFNRWGTEVYRKKNYSYESAWDGKNMKGEILPEDTYFYIFSITDSFNKVSTKKGFIVIKGQGND